VSIEIVFAEFGKQRPDETNVRKYFPEATVRHARADAFSFPDHPRWGWRMNDYWKVRAMVESEADIVIALDGDMRIVSDDVRTIIPLVERFGICLPSNSRWLVRVDTQIGADSDGQLDETNGTGYALNCAVMALQHGDLGSMALARAFLREMEAQPVRGPLAWWRAIYKFGLYPCLLPPQWCVCEKDIGCGNEIILHEGHESVRRHYAAHRSSR